MKTIKLQTSDSEIISVSEAVARESVIVKNILDDSDTNSDAEILIPVPNVRGEILKMVIEWIKKHSEKELSEEQVRDWETNFVDLDQNTMYELINAANYLDVNALLHRTCQKIADMISRKTPEQIRKMLGIPNDFTPEEEAELSKQNEWVLDPDTGASTNNNTNNSSTC